MKEIGKTKQSCQTQKNDGFLVRLPHAPFARLLEPFLHLRELFSFREDPLLRPSVVYIRSEEPEHPKEWMIEVPTSIRPEVLVISGCWEDSFPEVQLVQLGKQQIVKLCVESKHSMAEHAD